MIQIADGLIVILILSNVFWAWQCHTLLNKLMSRNYLDYTQAQSPPQEKQNTLEQEPNHVDDMDLGRATEILN